VDLDDDEVLRGLAEFDPGALEGLEDLSPEARHGVLSLYREWVAAVREQGGRRVDSSRAEAITDEALTGARLWRLRAAVQVHRAASERRDQAILDAIAVGYSWAEVARIVGVSRQALRQRLGGRAATQTNGRALG